MKARVGSLHCGEFRFGSLATRSNQQKIRPCLLCRRKRKQIQSINGSTEHRCGLMLWP
jgi:hypothetical protein